MDFAAAIAFSSALFFVIAVACVIVGDAVWRTTNQSRIERRGRRIQIWGGLTFGALAFIGWFVAIWQGFLQASGGSLF